MKDMNLIVMIDDDTDDHEIFKMALSDLELPYHCLFFLDCESTVAHFDQSSVNTPAFVFIDLTLPRIGGKECLEKLQRLSEFDHPCIIIYSTSIPIEWHERLKAVGVHRFIEKVGSVPHLVDQLQQLLA